MKQILGYIYLILALASAGAFTAKGAGTDALTHRLEFDLSTLNIEEKHELTGTWSDISMGELPMTEVDGEPNLPFRSLVFSVPFNATGFTAGLTDAVWTERPLASPLRPYEDKDRWMIAGNTLAEAEAYAQARAIPVSGIEVVSEGVMRGFNRIVTVRVYPVRYDAEGLTLGVLTAGEVMLSWSSVAEPSERALVPKFEASVSSALEEVRGYVDNPGDVDVNYRSLQSGARSLKAASTEEYAQYLIVTTRELSPAFARLLALRKLRGIQGRIVHIEDILADSRFKDGDLISNINDDAGKLRAFLTYAYENYGTEYVLLAGKYPKMPARMVAYNDARYISDTYLGELNSSWGTLKSDGSTEQTSIMYDGYELMIGRINASSIKEIKNYTDKVYYYELNPGNGNPEYLGNAFISSSCEMKAPYFEYLKSSYEQTYNHIDSIFQNSVNKPTGSEVISVMNTNQWGYVDFRGHGNPYGVGTVDKNNNQYDNHPLYNNYGINALDSEVKWETPETGNGLDCLRNKYYPHWSISMSCTLNPFITEANYTYTFADSYILGADYGGVAFWGNTEAGYIRSSTKLQMYMFESLLMYNITLGRNLLSGNLGPNGKALYYKNSKDIRLVVRNCLAGDPMVNLWNGKPRATTPEGKGINIYGLAPTAKVYIGNRDLANRGKPASQMLSYSAAVEGLVPSANTISTVYRGDVIPVFLPLQVHGIEFDYTDYIIGGKILFGNEQQLSSHVAFIENANITFEAKDGVDLRSSIYVEENSRCVIDSHCTINIDNATLYGDGEMVVSGKSTVIGPGTCIDKGISVIISGR